MKATPLIGIGQVRHLRLRPARHGFAYPSWFLLLPMRALREEPHPDLARNRFAAVSFHDRDHGAGGDDSLAWLETLLAAEGIGDVDGEIWLQCFARVLGFAFKPVSFWYGHRRDGSLGAVVVEVNNTFGERHCYLLHGPGLGFGREVRAAKVFHVSPFCAVRGEYRFRFLRTDLQPASETAHPTARTIVRIDHHDDAGVLIQTSISGRLEPLDRRALGRAFRSMPLLTLGVLARIHWQAVRLALRRLPWFAKPAPPASLVTRQEAR